jgi:hypothetical protein
MWHLVLVGVDFGHPAQQIHVGGITLNKATPRRTDGSVLSAHRTSQGILRYRWWWPGWISVELLRDEPAAIVATVPAAECAPPMTVLLRH